MENESGFLPQMVLETGHNEVPIASGSTCLCFRVTLNGRSLFKKQIAPSFAENQLYHDLFCKEYEIGTKLDSSYLVKYLDFQDDAQECYLLTEFVNGETLEERLSSNPDYFSIEKNLHKFLVQLLSGLDYLHRQRVVHLDLKPSNIMLTKVNNDVKILDLGYCYCDSYNSLLGYNSAFAAPEQLDGSANLDARTDLYTVGKLLQFILRSVPTSDKRCFRKYFHVIQKCMMERKEDRYQQAQDIIDELNSGSSTMTWVIFGFCTLLVSVAILCSFNVFSYLHRWFYGYDFQYCGVCYNITSREDRTCEAVGYLEDLDELRDKTDATIESVVMNGRDGYTVTSIGDSAFINKHILRSLSIPSSVRHIGISAFRNCCNISTLTIPDSLHSLGTSAFSQMSRLASVRFPKSAREVPYFCFHQTGLRSIELPEGVTKICQDAFVDCDSLVSVSLPSTLTYIDRGVFYECEKLEEIVLPAGLVSIGEYCFMQCKSLKRVVNMSPVPQRLVDVFDAENDIILYVPDESIEQYRKAACWRDLDVRPLSSWKQE